MRPPYKSSSSTELISLLARCARQDRAAFKRLYTLQADTLYSAALGILRSPSLAADALHETMMQVWQNAGRFDPKRGNPRVWLITIARYRAFDLANRFGRPTENIDFEAIADDRADPLEQLEDTETVADLRRCLKRIPPERRWIVILAYGQGITQTTLASDFGRPLGTIKSMLRRALAELRSCLGDTQ